MHSTYDLFQTQASANKQLYTLLRFACRCDHATTLTFNTFESATALFAAKCNSIRILTLLAVDENIQKLYKPIAETLEINFAINQSSDTIEETDLLYIDTPAEGNFRAMELNKYCDSVRKYIILPKTTVNGLTPSNNITLQDNQTPIGLNFGINHFLQTHDDWFILEHDDLDPGMTVLVNKRNVSNAYS
jgi:hypothetical protein